MHWQLSCPSRLATTAILAGLISLMTGGGAAFSQTPSATGKPVSDAGSLAVASSRGSGMTEARLEQLLSQMTLQEKIGQLSQGQAFRTNTEELVRQGSIGSVIAGRRPMNDTLQRVAIQQSRLGIPLLVAYDVIHGYRTIFPIPLGQAAAWNPQLTEQAAVIAAREAASQWIRWTYAPMVDIARDPRWGRIAEGAGEDPYLDSVLGAAMVRGFQGKDLSDPEHVAACAKHFAAYGAAEGGRDYNTVDISERTLRDVYLPPFHACVNAHVATLMSAFADVNGIPATANAFLLRDVLRREWGFDGFVISDANAIHELVAHGLVENDKDASQAAFLAGVDVEMFTACYRSNLESLVTEGKIPRQAIDDSVRRVLRLKWQLGLFDKPFARPNPDEVLLRKDHLETAREFARESIVLLKNDNRALPLWKEMPSVAVIGPLADDPHDQLGTWRGMGEDKDCRTPLQAIREAVGKTTKVNYAPGLESCSSTNTGGFEDAVRAARESTDAVVFVGEPAGQSGEASSRAYLNLPGAQLDLIRAIRATGTPMIVVLMAGRPLEIGDVLDAASGVLMAWHPGTMGGPAIADVLFGDDSPSGKLPISWPRTVGQIPIYYNHMSTGRPWLDAFKAPGPGRPGGYITGYFDLPQTPQFPFGYGLSYTQFEYSNLRVDPPHIKVGESVHVTARIRNLGERPADEIAQLYIRDMVADVPRPVRELKGFQRVTVQPGQSKDLEFTLSTDALAFHNREMKLVTEPGRYRVWVSGDSASGQPVEFEVE
ncbi:MAG TPA: glycoside hydrolase family 3 N-terminal domain-containing protein [Verrucomicrobiae bacterium]|nr:glycoside hydrolase family 3 N-terminal domain-containing protein [Verrucomicrobiae bacterium]